MDSIKQRILALAKAKPEVIDNQNDLIMSYWAVFDRIVKFSDIPYATKAETIIRQFRSLSDTGQLTALRPRKNKPEKELKFKHEFESLL